MGDCLRFEPSHTAWLGLSFKLAAAWAPTSDTCHNLISTSGTGWDPNGDTRCVLSSLLTEHRQVPDGVPEESPKQASPSTFPSQHDRIVTAGRSEGPVCPVPGTPTPSQTPPSPFCSEGYLTGSPLPPLTLRGTGRAHTPAGRSENAEEAVLESRGGPDQRGAELRVRPDGYSRERVGAS